MRKNLLMIGLAGMMAASAAMTSFAGEWRLDNVGYWWQNDDGSYPVSSWQWLDGNRDGVAECYYFGQDGYMAANTEIDGYTVNSDGAWTVDGVVQTKADAGAGDAAKKNQEMKAQYKRFLEENGANPDEAGNSRQWFDEHMTDYFCLLDINQDGIDELLCGTDEEFSGITVYAGEDEIYSTDGTMNVIYDQNYKVFEVVWWGHAGGLGFQIEEAVFFNGSSWKEESVSHNALMLQINPGDRLLSYSEFCSEVEGGGSPELYENYKETWTKVTTFRQKYDWYNSRNKIYPKGVKNTAENRERLLK